MKLVIEIPDDLSDDEALKVFLRNMQKESDDHAAESPDDYWEGFGSMELRTPHMATGAKILGVLWRDSEFNNNLYFIEPIGQVKP